MSQKGNTMNDARRESTPSHGCHPQKGRPKIAETEGRQETLQDVERLATHGLVGPTVVLQRALAQRQWREHLRQVLSQAFPDLSTEEREDCIAQHLHRWKAHLITASGIGDTDTQSESYPWRKE
jgi:hypothetical protein